MPFAFVQFLCFLFWYVFPRVFVSLSFVCVVFLVVLPTPRSVERPAIVCDWTPFHNCASTIIGAIRSLHTPPQSGAPLNASHSHRPPDESPNVRKERYKEQRLHK